MIDIRTWAESTFGSPEPKVIFELGAHKGEDTAWLAALPGATVYAFEPDPRNALEAIPANVVFERAAVSDHDGRAALYPSESFAGLPWTCSSSLRRPKRHLERYPVAFGEPVEVEVVALDTYCRRRGIDAIDFIWADIQGAEGDMVRGGRSALAHTRYFYTEFSNEELYAGQVSLADLCALLPEFRVRDLDGCNVLFERRA